MPPPPERASAASRDEAVARLCAARHDGCAAAVRQLRAAKSATREAAAQKAGAVVTSLHAAIDNVVQQFTSGLRATVPAALSAQAHPVGCRCRPPLCTGPRAAGCVHAEP